MPDYISVYADHAIDKQISSADWSYPGQLVQHCRYLCSSARQLCLLPKRACHLRASYNHHKSI